MEEQKPVNPNMRRDREVNEIMEIIDDPDINVQMTAIGKAIPFLLRNKLGAIDPILHVLQRPHPIIPQVVLKALTLVKNQQELRKAIEASGKRDELISIISEIAKTPKHRGRESARILLAIFDIGVE